MRSKRTAFVTGATRDRMRTRVGADGFTMLETVIAMAILIIAIVGVMALFAFAFKANISQGDPSTRTVEYSQDKMESLLQLPFSDTTTTTTVWPYCSAPSCVPVGGKGLAAGGSADPQNPQPGYYDYLSAIGDLQTSSAGAAYIRVWSITQDAGNDLKTITVVAASLKVAPAVSTTLVCQKSDQQ